MSEGAEAVAFDAFLIITPGDRPLPDGIQLVGDPSPDARDPNGIAVEVAAFAFGVENAETIGAATGGVGKAHNTPFTVTRKVDGLSPALLALTGEGTRFAQMELYVRKSTQGSGNLQTSASLAYTFRQVAITDVDWSGASGDEAPTEAVTFRYLSLTDTTFAPLPQATATPSPTTTPSPSVTPSPTATATPSPATATPSPTTTPTASPLPTTTPTATSLPSTTPTTTPSPLPTTTPSPTPTQLPTSTPTPTPLPTSTPTATPSPSVTPSPTIQPG